jgi:hypothetical protein
VNSTRFLIVVVAVAACATATATWLITRRDGPADDRPVVGVDRLLLTAPPPGLDDDPAQWTVERTWSYPDLGASNLVRRWSAGGRAPELTQTVARYPDAADARRALRADDPAEQAARQFSGRPTRADPGVRLSSSEATVSCAAADRAGCKIWVYWARYGQYTVGLDYTSVDAPVPLGRFAAHVAAVDQHITAALGASTTSTTSPR